MSLFCCICGFADVPWWQEQRKDGNDALRAAGLRRSVTAEPRKRWVSQHNRDRLVDCDG